MDLGVWQLLAMFTKFVMYIGLLASAGITFNLVLFESDCAPVRDRLTRQARWLALIALLATILRFDICGATLMGDASGLMDAEILSILWDSAVGTAVMWRAIGLLLIILGTAFDRGKYLSIVGAFVAIWSFYFVGHISERGELLLHVLVFVHLLVAAFWIGILSPLRMLSFTDSDLGTCARLGHRFGKIAAVSVPLLMIAGVVMTYHLLGSIQNVLFSTYGQFLLFKIACVGGLLTLAALNKLRFIPKMLEGNQFAAKHLRRAVNLEVALFAAILLTTAILTTLLTLSES